jgi:hypothetical protein
MKEKKRLANAIKKKSKYQNVNVACGFLSFNCGFIHGKD